MRGLAFAAPILPGKIEQWKAFSENLATGPRRSEFVAFMKKCGVSRVRCWGQQGPEGALAIILYEGDTPEGFQQQMGTSQEPFAVWFRECIQDQHGMDLASLPGPPPELVSDVEAE